MKTTTLAALLCTVTLCAVALSGCCGGCGEALQTDEGREEFIEVFNKGQEGCKLSSASGESDKASYTCEQLKVAEMEAILKQTCGGFQAVGFKQVSLAAADGQRQCEVVTGCGCAEAAAPAQ